MPISTSASTPPASTPPISKLFLRGLELAHDHLRRRAQAQQGLSEGPLPQAHHRRHREPGHGPLRRRRAARGHPGPVACPWSCSARSPGACSPRSSRRPGPSTGCTTSWPAPSPSSPPSTEDIAAGWVLRLLEKYPTAERIAAAHLASLEKIPYLSAEQAQAVHQAAKQSVASLRGEHGRGAGPRAGEPRSGTASRPSSTSASC